MEILRIPRHGVSKAAFSDKLMCPRISGDGICGGTDMKFICEVQPFRHRYQCKKCGRTLQYDFSNNPLYMQSIYGKNTGSIISKIKNKFNLR